ncbi:hypothetical protein Tco_0312443 [Tanacetum coccineum]
MNNEWTQKDVDKQCADIERNNILIENGILIAENVCQSIVSRECDERSCEPLLDDKDVNDLHLNRMACYKDLKAQLEGNLKVATRSSVKTKVLAPGMYAIDVEPIPPRLKNNRSAHLDYINHLKESVETICEELLKEARIVKPLDSALTSACQYTKRSQEFHEMCVVNILNSVNATPTVKIVLNKGKQIWKPKGKLSDNSLNKIKQVWKATGKLFANIGYQWRPTGKKVALGN